MHHVTDPHHVAAGPHVVTHPPTTTVPGHHLMGAIHHEIVYGRHCSRHSTLVARRAPLEVDVVASLALGMHAQPALVIGHDKGQPQ